MIQCRIIYFPPLRRCRRNRHCYFFCHLIINGHQCHFPFGIFLITIEYIYTFLFIRIFYLSYSKSIFICNFVFIHIIKCSEEQSFIFNIPSPIFYSQYLFYFNIQFGQHSVTILIFFPCFSSIFVHFIPFFYPCRFGLI